MAHDLFVYGALLFDDVFAAVTGAPARRVPATLDGFARYRIRGATYPAMVREPGAHTEGAIYLGLDGEAMGALDRFEGEMYVREVVEVRLEDASLQSVETYVFLESLRDLLDAELWLPDVHGPAARAELGRGPTD